MKKIILFLVLLFTPFLAYGTIDTDLYYGLVANSEVRELQQYLIGKGFLTGNATGNFYSLTYSAVKSYQASKSIRSTGYVGPLTREVINADLAGTSTSAATTAIPATTTGQTQLSGSLDLTKNSGYTNKSVTSPQLGFKLADFNLTNGTAEAINLNQVQANLSIDSGLVVNLYVKNTYIQYDNNKTLVRGVTVGSNYWPLNYKILSGQTINFSLYGDIDSSIPVNSVVSSGLLINGTMEKSKTAVSTNSGNILAGQSSTFGTKSLAVSADGSTTESKIVVANQMINAGQFKFEAYKDSFTVSKLKFVVPISLGATLISKAVLLDTETQAVLPSKFTTESYNSNGYILDFSNLDFTIPINSSKSVTVSYTLSSSTSPLNVNKNIAPTLVYVKATDSDKTPMDGVASDYSSSVVSFYDNISLASAGVTVGNVYAFRSLPTFSAESSNRKSSNGASSDIYTFNISADKAGDVAVKQIIFKISLSDSNKNYPRLRNFKLFKGTTDYTGSVTIGKSLNNVFTNISTALGLGDTNLILIFDKEETIKAGTTQTYTLKAELVGFASTSSGSISIPQDTVYSSNGYLKNIFTGIYGLSSSQTSNLSTSYNILWSDKSALAFSIHSDVNGSSTQDWFNGFKIPKFPLETQTLGIQ